jgi:hypothetical protein
MGQPLRKMEDVCGIGITAATKLRTFDAPEHLKVLAQPATGAVIFAQNDAFILGQ